MAVVIDSIAIRAGAAFVPEPRQAPSVVRFGVFEADFAAGELRRQGIKIKLQEQPLQILEVLLERPGEIVSREELQKRVWPADTFVDFDHGLYSAITRLREALGDSSGTPRYIETVARRGYRFIAPVDRQATTIDREAVNGARVVPPPSLPRQPLRRSVSSVIAGLLGGITLLALLLGFNIGGAREWMWRHSSPPIRSLAVLPLENFSGDPQQDYFADGMTDELISSLAQLGSVRVISLTSAMQYKHAKKTLPEIARELHVDAVVEGSVLRSGQRVRVTAQLIDAARDQHLWGNTYERDFNDVLILQSEMSRAIASEIRLKLTPEQESTLSRAARVDPAVQDDYLRGRYHLNNGGGADIRKAVEYFQHAISRDPKDARSYAGLAESYLALDDYYEAPSETMPRAREAAQKAADSDPGLAEAHMALGGVLFLHDWDWAGAEKEMKRAIELNPGSADAHTWYAEFLAQMGRGAEAISEIQRAETLDPLSVVIHSQAGWVFYLARRDKEAVAEWGKVIDLQPDFATVHTSIWAAYLQMPEFRKVLTEVPEDSVTGESTVNLAALAGSYAVAGKRQEAEQTLAKLDALSKTRYVCAYEMGTAHAILGDKDRAIACLRRAYQAHSGCLADLKTDRRWDGLRTDPRFQELLNSLRFPK
jgi:TolB-like protein/DNA-binding winged helix-turn-helix (wHTH) protein/Tfp pilus assembly protein PilF